MCPTCGLVSVAPVGIQEGLSKPSNAWYLVPILFSWIGSIIGYLALKNRHKQMARHVAIAGLVMSFVWLGVTAFLPFPKPTIEIGQIVQTPAQTQGTMTSPESMIASQTEAATTVQTSLVEAPLVDVGKWTPSIPAIAGEEIVLEGYDWTGGSLVLELGNVGTSDVEIGAVYVNGVSASSSDLPKTIAARDKGVVTAIPKGALSKGSAYTVKVTTTTGGVFSYSCIYGKAA